MSTTLPSLKDKITTVRVAPFVARIAHALCDNIDALVGRKEAK